MNTLIVALQRETEARERRLRDILGHDCRQELDWLRLEASSSLRPYLELLEERIDELTHSGGAHEAIGAMAATPPQ